MNREIKFRAWAENKMHHFDLSDTIAPSLEDNVMQFTGLKDKKGNDIYEGDIVDYRCDSQPKKEDLRIVKFHENGFYSATGGYDINLYAIKNACKVVGNIYETPELKTGF